MRDRLFDWFSHLKVRQTAPDAFVAAWTERSEKGGIILGQW